MYSLHKNSLLVPHSKFTKKNYEKTWPANHKIQALRSIEPKFGALSSNTNEHYELNPLQLQNFKKNETNIKSLYQYDLVEEGSDGIVFHIKCMLKRSKSDEFIPCDEKKQYILKYIKNNGNYNKKTVEYEVFLLRKVLYHDNFAQLHRFIKPNILIMENAGQSLRNETFGTLKLDGIIPQVLDQAKTILLELRTKKIIHQDIKPGNLCWKYETNKLILVDFGRSAMVNHMPIIEGGNEFKRHFDGTPLYRFWHPIDLGRTNKSCYVGDEWSMGVTLFRLTFGIKPFSDETDKNRTLEATEIEKTLIVIQENPEFYKAFKAFFENCTKYMNKVAHNLSTGYENQFDKLCDELKKARETEQAQKIERNREKERNRNILMLPREPGDVFGLNFY